MKHILICGGGGLAREAYQMLKECMQQDASLSFVGFLAPENTLMPFSYLNGLYLGSEDTYTFSENETVILAIGEISIRQKVHTKLKQQNVSFYNLIHPTSVVADTAIIGEGNIIGYHCVLFPDTKIGDANLFNGNNLIHHDTNIGSFNNLYSRVILTGETTLGNANILGSAAVLLPRAALTDRCKLGAGAVLHTAIENRGKTLVGNPAGIIK